MSLNVSSCATAPLPLQGGGAAPLPTDVAGATGAAATDPSTPPAAITGGGSQDLASALAGLQQALAGLTQLLEQLQANGAGAVAGATGGGAALGQGCGTCGGSVEQGPPGKMADISASAELAPPAAPAPAAGPAPAFDAAPLKVKGVEVDPEQRENIKQVLQVGKEMGANRKVLESAVATMIQESTAKNLDTAVDHDSLGLFQQRPSQGWGTPEQVLDPKYAARKYFEKAIEADKKDGGQPMTVLAQSVQRSAFPDAYAQWEGEAKAAVDAFGA